MRIIHVLCITVLLLLICSCENEVYEPKYLYNTYDDEEEEEKEEVIPKVKVYLSQDNEILKYISEPWSGRRGCEVNFTYDNSKVIEKGMKLPRNEYDREDMDNYALVYSFGNQHIFMEMVN
jgi:protein involved in sex pheromone biosynthesis